MSFIVITYFIISVLQRAPQERGPSASGVRCVHRPAAAFNVYPLHRPLPPYITPSNRWRHCTAPINHFTHINGPIFMLAPWIPSLLYQNTVARVLSLPNRVSLPMDHPPPPVQLQSIQYLLQLPPVPMPRYLIPLVSVTYCHDHLVGASCAYVRWSGG
jgi:hypothetical protein